MKVKKTLLLVQIPGGPGRINSLPPHMAGVKVGSDGTAARLLPHLNHCVGSMD